MDKLIKQKPNELDLITKHPPTYIEFELASLWKVFFARLFDLILISLPFLIAGYIIGNNIVDNWVFLFVNYLLAIVINILYFVLFPFFLKGRTLGKLIFRIKVLKLPDDKKITFKELLLRELWMLIGPWMIYFLLMVTSLALAYAFNTTKKELYFTFANIIYQASLLIFAGWIIGLCISIKMQKNHQCMIDMKFNIIITNANLNNSLVKIPPSNNSLKETPGFFQESVLEEIEKTTMSKSINVDKKQTIDDLENIAKQKKSIEGKGENDN